MAPAMVKLELGTQYPHPDWARFLGQEPRVTLDDSCHTSGFP